MKNKLKNICISATVVAFTGCGGGTTPGTGDNSSENGTNNSASTTPPASIDYGNNKIGILQAGLIKNAKVKIIELDLHGRRVKTIAEETTSDGDFNHAGYFNTHSSELKDDTYYKYIFDDADNAVDMDSNLDGKEDKNAEQYGDLFLGDVSVVVRGDWVKALGDNVFRLTLFSDYLSRKVSFQNVTEGLEKNFTDVAKKYVLHDIDGDGNIDFKDVIAFNPNKNLQDVVGAYGDVIREGWKYFVGIGMELLVEQEYKRLKGTVSLTCGGADYAIRKDDNTFIVSGGSSTSSGIFTLVDTSDLATMHKVGEIKQKLEIIGFSKKNRNILYAVKTAKVNKLVTIDISNNTPHIVNEISDKHIPTAQSPVVLSSDETRIYVIHEDAKKVRTFEIYDLSNEIPNLISSTKISGKTRDVVLGKDKNTLYFIEEWDRGIGAKPIRVTRRAKKVDISDIHDVKIEMEYIEEETFLLAEKRFPHRTTDESISFRCESNKLNAYKK